MRLFDPTLTLLERSLDVRLERHEVLAGNVANVDTPGYTPLDVDLAAAIEARERGDAQPLPVRESPSQAGLDGNGVDLDRALAALAQNALEYGAASRAAAKKLAILRYVASDGVG